MTLVPVREGDDVRRFSLSGTPLRLRAVFSPDSSRLATILNRRLKILLETAAGRLVLDANVDYRFGAETASFSADGRELAIEIDSQFEVRDAR